MASVIVLGGGMVGSVLAADLASDPSLRVTLADRRPESLQRAAERCPGKLEVIHADLSDAARVGDLVSRFDLAVGALSSTIGYRTMKAVIDAGVGCCDISFMPEDPLDLDGLARERGVTVVPDCGVAPGMSNVLAAEAAAQLDEPQHVEILVGGLPRERRWPFEYKAAFSPADALEEYTRPARLVEGGRVVTREALSEPELIDLPGVGTLEAFNTDGLRSLIRTLKVPHMKEKTLRYPGHAGLMRIFREAGLMDREPVRVGDVSVRPIDVLSALLFPKWTYQEGEEDLTVMRVAAEGVVRAGAEQSHAPPGHGTRTRVSWDMLDLHDGGATSMSRTTAFPAAIVARMMLEGLVKGPGVVPPERLGQDPELFDRIIREHERRGVRYTCTVERI
jgi:lysine 6-dehydrogenase